MPLSEPTLPVCVASAEAAVRARTLDALRLQRLRACEADSLGELAERAADGIALAVVDPRLPGLGDAPLGRLRAEPALQASPILLLAEEEIEALRDQPPGPALVTLLVRVHSQLTDDGRIRLLTEVGGQLTASPRLDDTLGAVLRAVAERVETDTATLFLLTDDGDLEARAAWGYDLGAAQLRRLPAGEGLVGWVVTRRAPTIVGDSDLDARFASLDGRSSRSMLAVPLLVGPRVVGALTLVRRNPDRQFTDRDLTLAATIATGAGIAVEHARLWEQERVLEGRLAEADRLVGEERRMLAEIEEYDRLYTQVVATVSHELKTPLMGIRGFAEMLRDEALSPRDARDFGGEIFDNAGRLIRYVEGILQEDKVHSGTLSVDLRPVDVAPLVATVLRALQPTLSAAHSLVAEVAPGLPAVRADSDKLIQVLTNLVSNAVKYSPDGGVIRVEAWSEGSAVVLAVDDEGMGIPAEARSRVFDRFYRVPDTEGRAISGTGLGLSIVRGIVELFGGRIGVEEGRRGRGSRFVVSLEPATEAEIAAVCAEPPAAAAEPAAAAAALPPLPDTLHLPPLPLEGDRLAVLADPLAAPGPAPAGPAPFHRRARARAGLARVAQASTRPAEDRIEVP